MRSSRVKIAVVVSSVIFLAASVTIRKMSARQRPTRPAELVMAPDFSNPRSALVIEPEFVDLGEQPAGSTVERDIVIRNRGDGTVNNLGTLTSCTCVALVQPEKSLAPGSSTSFRVRFTLPKKQGHHAQKIFITSGEPKRARAVAKIVAMGVVDPGTAMTDGAGTVNAVHAASAPDAPHVESQSRDASLSKKLN